MICCVSNFIIEDAKICHLATSKTEFPLCDRRQKPMPFRLVLGLERFGTQGVTGGETSDK